MSVNKVIVAIDSLKGCISSGEANQAATDGIKRIFPDWKVIQIPVSDGGEGWLEAFQAAIGGKLVKLPVYDPMMRTIEASYLMKDHTEIIEIAKASGLSLLTQEERNPMRATSYGTGQLVADAVLKRCTHIIVGLGGSATSDCGKGMLRAIIDTLSPKGSWRDIQEKLSNTKFTIATDVMNPLCGENGAARIFAPQKGATPKDVDLLDTQAHTFARFSAQYFGFDCQDIPGAGAAGGLGYAFLQYMDAECQSGINLLLDTVNFHDKLEKASLVITGEGTADQQTLMGKLPLGILEKAKTMGVPVALIAGRVFSTPLLLQAGFSSVTCIHPEGISMMEAMNPETTKRNISHTVQEITKNL